MGTEEVGGRKVRAIIEGSLKGDVLVSDHLVYCLTRTLFIMKLGAINNYTRAAIGRNQDCPRQTGGVATPFLIRTIRVVA